MMRHKAIHLRRTIACEVCEKVFTTKEIKDLHFKANHTKFEPQACVHCSRVCLDRSSLETHVDMVHSMAVSCTQCSKTFKSRSSCSRHFTVMHGRQKLGVAIRCQHCPMKFSHKAAFHKHQLTMHDEMPLEEPLVKCDICSQRFHLKEELAVHLETHFDD